MVSPWKSLEQWTDRVVDEQFGEPVVLYPMMGGDTATEPSLDPSREIITTTGIYVRPGAALTGEAGFPAMSSAPMEEADVWLSIVSDVVGDPPIFGKDDRVYFPDRGEWLAISFVDPSATGRPNIHLLRLNPNSVTVYPSTLGLTVSPPTLGAP